MDPVRRKEPGLVSSVTSMEASLSRLLVLSYRVKGSTAQRVRESGFGLWMCIIVFYNRSPTEVSASVYGYASLSRLDCDLVNLSGVPRPGRLKPAPDLSRDS